LNENCQPKADHPEDEKYMNYFLKIYGCQYNEWDGARLDHILSQLGLISTSEKDADVIFILSCSVRKSAVDRAMSVAKNNAGKKVIVTGCILESDRAKYEKKNVKLWDINKPERLASLLFEDATAPEKFSLRSKDINDAFFGGNIKSTYLPIMSGCNNFCSYCAVPYVRGREKSKPFNEVISDFKKMVKNGHKEIILLGQNVNSYGKNYELGIMNYGINHKSPFATLLKTLNDVPGDFAIKFTSNHPKDMSDDIIAAIKDLPKVKKEIHLPFQSGSNKILEAMNRPYTKQQYLKLVNKIKKEIPNIKITTDTIVGFPGETEKDFQETIDVFNRVGFSQAFNNKYSPRDGTAAFKLGDPVPWQEKQRRWKILNEMVNKKGSPKLS